MMHFLLFPLLLVQAPRDSLSLDAALARARAQRGQPRAAAALVAAARAGVRVAGTVPNPIGGYSYTEDTPRQHVTLEQSLDWLLIRGAGRQAASSVVRRAEADSAQAMATLMAEVRLAFYGVHAAGELTRLTTEQRVLADSLARLGAERLARGDIAEQERDQLLLEATRAAQLESRAREALAVAWARLARSIGWNQAAAPPPLGGTLGDGLAAEPTGGTPLPPLDAVPSVAGAVADSAAAAARARSAARARVPLPSVQLGADWDDPSNKDSFLALFGVTFPLPLWQHGGGAKQLADAEAAQAGAGAAEARLETARAMAEAAARLSETRARALIARDSLLPVAHRIRVRATSAYRLGETGLIALLEALRAERDVTAEAVDELLAFQEARAAWNQVLGQEE